VSQYQKGKTNLDFTEARDSEWQWHQLGRMQVCTSLQTDNHASTRLLFFTGQMPFLPPNRQCQSTEGICLYIIVKNNCYWNPCSIYGGGFHFCAMLQAYVMYFWTKRATTFLLWMKKGWGQTAGFYWSVLCVFLSFLTLLVRCQKSIQSVKILCHFFPRSSVMEQAN